jgi:hypothetical protein
VGGGWAAVAQRSVFRVNEPKMTGSRERAHIYISVSQIVSNFSAAVCNKSVKTDRLGQFLLPVFPLFRTVDGDACFCGEDIKFNFDLYEI